jgi:hypothetical protein
MNSILGNIMSSNPSSAYGGQQTQNVNPQHAGGLIHNAVYGAVGAQNAYNMANNAYAQNQAAFQQMAAQQAYNKVRKPKEFRINGRDMDFEEFLDTLYSDDCPEKTYLALKLAKGEDQ